MGVAAFSPWPWTTTETTERKNEERARFRCALMFVADDAERDGRARAHFYCFPRLQAAPREGGGKFGTYPLPGGHHLLCDTEKCVHARACVVHGAATTKNYKERDDSCNNCDALGTVKTPYRAPAGTLVVCVAAQVRMAWKRSSVRARSGPFSRSAVNRGDSCGSRHYRPSVGRAALNKVLCSFLVVTRPARAEVPRCRVALHSHFADTRPRTRRTATPTVDSTTSVPGGTPIPPSATAPGRATEPPPRPGPRHGAPRTDLSRSASSPSAGWHGWKPRGVRATRRPAAHGRSPSTSAASTRGFPPPSLDRARFNKSSDDSWTREGIVGRDSTGACAT